MNPPTRPWRRAALWLLVLGTLFYSSYGLANWLAGQRAHVPSIVFSWEHAIPFIAWTIVPYWSVNAFYALSLFVCRDRRELDTHALRLLTAQVVAVVFFIATPLAFSFSQPQTEGLPGLLFAALKSFDRPYN
ncbi:MAG: serine/threonine protein phosphatase, partial [Rhodanobacter sp.]